MNITPDLYNNCNYLQQRDGKRLIQRIVDDFPDKHFNTIVDLGCGTGNITNELATKLSHQSIIGVDISEPMIKFAAENYRRPTVQYLAADICDEWPKFKDKLQLAEHSVDLIVSIYCLHWVSDLDETIKNIIKLLKPGGYCYILLFSWSDLLPIQQKMAIMDKWQQYFFAIPKNWNRIAKKSRETIRKLSEHLAPFPVFEAPDEQQLLAKWRDLCRDNGLHEPETVLTHTYYQFANHQQFNNVLQAMCHFLPYIPDDQTADFMAEYLQLVNDDYISKQLLNGKLVQTTNETPVRLNYDHMIVVTHIPV
ncbi:juvenile hormone acid O-methyltransferase-like [Oppia nitens]|uniref:juvenile hormone acid O-methyltransferase-like n=1 Tax=Oppia nitens TaxID=1686743 RepID=UPI0023DC58C6|nr:juvenile hormone acid O-methyltransferase-like [Oppia nitens]